MKLAVLFWCYKEPAICEDRVRLLRRHDPRTPIYVLFGGEPGEAGEFERRLGPWVQDFWVSREECPPGGELYQPDFRGGSTWKYVYGDVLIAAWYRERGARLAWDTVVVVQWDMLVCGPIGEVFACLGPGEALFSGLRPLREVEREWIWTDPRRPRQRAMYEEFLRHVRERYGYDQEPLACLAIVMALPRALLEHFSRVERLELGFLEYRLPIYAQAFGVPLCTRHPFRPWWGAVERYRLFSTLRALPREIWAPTIAWHLARRDGARVFHPFWRPLPRGWLGWTRELVLAVPRLALAASRSLAARARARVRRARTGRGTA